MLMDLDYGYRWRFDETSAKLGSRPNYSLERGYNCCTLQTKWLAQSCRCRMATPGGKLATALRGVRRWSKTDAWVVSWEGAAGLVSILQ